MSLWSWALVRWLAAPSSSTASLVPCQCASTRIPWRLTLKLGTGIPQRSHHSRNRSSKLPLVCASFGLVDLKGLFEAGAPRSPVLADRAECAGVEFLAVVEVGECAPDDLEAAGGREINEGPRDCGDGQSRMEVALVLPLAVDLDTAGRLDLARSGDFDQARGVVDQPAPVCGCGVAQHRAGTGVENRSPQVGLTARRGVANGVDPREHAMDSAVFDPTAQHGVADAQLAELRAGDAPGLGVDKPLESFSGEPWVH